MTVQPMTTGEAIAIWSKAVDTQMHFNEMAVKSRQLGLTFVAAALGVAIVLLSNGQDFSLEIRVFGCNFILHVAVLIIFGAWIALNAVETLDLDVYHKMLRGAVAFGEDFEETHLKKIFELEKGMTQAISHFSRYSDASVQNAGGKAIYSGSNKNLASQKIEGFYFRTKLFLVVAGILLLVFTNLSFEKSSVEIPLTNHSGTTVKLPEVTSEPPAN